jgi:hypothetical protein
LKNNNFQLDKVITYNDTDVNSIYDTLEKLKEMEKLRKISENYMRLAQAIFQPTKIQNNTK